MCAQGLYASGGQRLSNVFFVFSWFSHGFLWFFIVFSKNWISKNWKSIDIHCWTPSMKIDGFPSMNINGFPSIVGPFFGPHWAAVDRGLGLSGRGAWAIRRDSLELWPGLSYRTWLKSWGHVVFHCFFKELDFKELEIHRYSLMDTINEYQ